MSAKIYDFKTLKKLGDGAFSTVYLVERITDGAKYAMKKVKMGKLTDQEKHNALNEVRILASIQHPNVIGYRDAFFENAAGNLCIVMECADNGDLLQMIEKHQKNKTKFTEKQIWHFFVQTVRGLKALHDLKISHRDIKCANIFITKNGLVKMGDLNVSKVAKKGMMHTQTGTPYYASPEVWQDKPYDNKSDIWSLGCVLYEMITLQPPFKAASMQGLSKKVSSGKYDNIPSHFSQELQTVVKQCLQVNPQNRPTCEKLLASPGLLKNMTRSQVDEKDDCENNLLATIKCPRNFRMITDKLPQPQYEPILRRSQSMAIDTADKLQTNDEINPQQRRNQQVNKSIENLKPFENADQVRRAKNKVLPTIHEDNIDDCVVNDPSKLGLVAHLKRNDQSSQISRRSCAHPIKVQNQQNLGINSVQNSDHEDAETRVSTAQSRKNAILPKKNLNDQYNSHNFRTPQYVPLKAQNLPQIKHNSRMASLDPPAQLQDQYQNRFSQIEQLYGNQRSDYQGGLEAVQQRYGGVGQALRLARIESKEIIDHVSSQNYHHQNSKIQRGPCPKNIYIPNVGSESDYRSLQQAQDLQRGLQAAYRRQKRNQYL